MNKTNNRRVQDTKQILKTSLLSLISQGKKVRDISIKELCSAANINRSTFYAHYSIPEDVLSETEEEILKKTMEYILTIHQNTDSGALLLLSYIKENRKTFQTLFSADRSFAERLADQTFPIFRHIVDDVKDKEKLLYIQAYALAGSERIITRWIMNDCDRSEQEVTNMLISLNKEVIDIAFRNEA